MAGGVHLKRGLEHGSWVAGAWEGLDGAVCTREHCTYTIAELTVN